MYGSNSPLTISHFCKGFQLDLRQRKKQNIFRTTFQSQYLYIYLELGIKPSPSNSSLTPPKHRIFANRNNLSHGGGKTGAPVTTATGLSRKKRRRSCLSRRCHQSLSDVSISDCRQGTLSLCVRAYVRACVLKMKFIFTENTEWSLQN